MKSGSSYFEGVKVDRVIALQVNYSQGLGSDENDGFAEQSEMSIIRASRLNQ